MEKNSLFNKLYWELWAAPNLQKTMKLDHQLTPYTKIKSKRIKDLNISCNTMKVLEDNISKKMLDIPCSNIFTNMNPLEQGT